MKLHFMINEKKNQTQDITYYVILFIGNFQNGKSIDMKSRLIGCQGLREMTNLGLDLFGGYEKF